MSNVARVIYSLNFSSYAVVDTVDVLFIAWGIGFVWIFIILRLVLSAVFANKRFTK